MFKCASLRCGDWALGQSQVLRKASLALLSTLRGKAGRGERAVPRLGRPGTAETDALKLERGTRILFDVRIIIYDVH